MRWLWFVGSLVCFAILFRTTSTGLAMLALVGALAFMLIGTLAVAAQRIDQRRNDATRLLGPEEIRHMREAEAKRKAAAEADSRQEPIIGVAAASAMLAAEAAAREVSPTASDSGADDGATARDSDEDPA